LFGDIAGKLDRHFFTGHFFPSLLFIALNVGFDYAKFLHIGLYPILHKFGLTWGIPLILTVSLFGGILLSALNRSIIRLFEGYPLRKLRIFRFLTARQRNKWHKINDPLNRLLEEYRALRSKNRKDPRLTAMLLEITRLQRIANNFLPPKLEHVLPTKLGNTIRAFEYYANVHYGIDSITLWSRLLSVIPKEFMNIIKDMKASFNFLINLVIIVILLGLELLVSPPYGYLGWRLLGASGSFIISFFLYRAAVNQAVTWGYSFNSAFDLYRRDLLKQLGFHPPSTLDKEKALWTKIMQFIRFKETKGLKFDIEDLKRKKRRSRLYEI